MLATSQVRESLLGYLLEHDTIDISGDFRTLDRDDLPCQFRDIIRRSVIISDFIYLLFLRYNLLLTDNQDDNLKDEWEKCYQHFQERKPDIIECLSILHLLPNKLLRNSLHFVEDCYRYILDEQWNLLDDAITRREVTIKRNRRKINNPEFEYKSPIHHYYLTYRWGTVQQMLKELRKEDLWQKN